MKSTMLDVAQLDRDGFALLDAVVAHEALERYRAALAAKANVAGVRNLFDAVPETRRLVDDARLARALAGVAGDSARIVRATLFDKAHGANWRVPWHQDLFVAVDRVDDVAGFSAWTRKDGVVHARAPREVLEHMLAVRIHIDDCDVDNGPLRVLRGTHRGGVLGGPQIDDAAASIAPHVCVARAGDALLLRPLLLHASSPSTRTEHRRVVHLDVATAPLPAPLRFATAMPLDG